MNLMAMAFEERAQSELGDLFDAGGAQLSDHYAEEQLLGILLNKPAATTNAVDILSVSDLHDPFHRRIYELLRRSFETGDPITATAIVAALGGNSGAMIVGDMTVSQYVAHLMADADMHADVAEIADHLQVISERRAVGTVEDVDFNRGAPFISRFGAQRWEDIATAGAAACYAWLVEDVIPLGEISLVFGDSGSGKSFGMFDLAMCSARGIKFNGRNVEKGLAIYIAAEAGKGFAKRKIAYAIQHGLESSEPLPFVLLTKRPDFFHDDHDVVALIDEIVAICRSYNVPLVCIVIDTLSALAPGMNENAFQDISMVRKRLVMLQDQFNAAIILVHHKPKNGTTPRGHGSLTADFETTIEFETVNDKKTDMGKTVHRASVRKQREDKSGIFWEFTLPRIEVGRNKWGNPETSCAVKPLNTAASNVVVGFHATPNEMLLMRALFDSINDYGQAPPAGLPKSITKVVDSRHVRALMRERSIAPHEDNEIADNRFRGTFKRAGDKLRDGGVLGVQGALWWYTGKAVRGFDIGGQL